MLLGGSIGFSRMKKLYVVRHFVEASSIKQAIREAKNREPDEVYIADEWVNKHGYLEKNDEAIKGF